jgi:hypothetical protein
MKATPGTTSEDCIADRHCDAHGRCRWCDVPMAILDEIAELRAEVERLRAALEEISDGVGCDSKYGPGCDTHCKTIAYRALRSTSAKTDGT